MNAELIARVLVGIILMVAGLALAAWAGVWWAFIGGIVQVIDAAKDTPINSWEIAYGVTRIAFSVPIVHISIAFVIGTGWWLIE